MRKKASDSSNSPSLNSMASLSSFQIRSSYQGSATNQRNSPIKMSKKLSIDDYPKQPIYHRPQQKQYEKLRQTLNVNSHFRIRSSFEYQSLEANKEQKIPKSNGFSRPSQYKKQKVSMHTSEYLKRQSQKIESTQKEGVEIRSTNNRKNLENKIQSFIATVDKFKNQLEESTKITQELLKIKQDRKKRKEEKYKEIIGLQTKFKSQTLEKVKDLSFKKKSMNEFESSSPQKNKYDLEVKDFSASLNLEKYNSIMMSEHSANQFSSNIHYRSKSNLDSTLSSISLHTRGSVRKNQLDRFIVGKCLGQGKFGKVFQAFHKTTGMVVALKRIPKAIIRQHLMIDQFVLEIKLQSFLNHPNITQIYHQFDDKNHIYLVLEYMEQGTLFSQLKKTKILKQKDTATKIRQIASAINYLHQNYIAHRDIKPENIVMSSGICKLCDFGWATICKHRRSTYCGTFDYAPPEILEGAQYDFTVDLWCLGILTYQLLVGKAPFYHISRQQTKNKILNVETTEIKFPEEISTNAKNFIISLLKKNPKERLSSEELLNHPFLRDNAEII